jgi:hypothetical protein
MVGLLSTTVISALEHADIELLHLEHGRTRGQGAIFDLICTRILPMGLENRGRATAGQRLTIWFSFQYIGAT